MLQTFKILALGAISLTATKSQGAELFLDLYAAGKLADASEVVPEPGSTLDRNTLLAAARLRLMQDRPDLAEAYLPPEPGADTEVLRLRALIHYRRQNWLVAADYFERAGETSKAAKLRHLGNLPSREDLGLDQTISIEMIRVDPIPVIAAQVNGQALNLIIDTGGAELILDDQVADELDLKRFGTQQGTFAADQKELYEHGIVDRVGLGDITLFDVPVNIRDTSAFAAATGGLPVHGVLGTTTLRRFVATLDYPGQRLVLAPRQAVCHSEAPVGHRIRMFVAGDHFLLAEGALGDTPSLMLLDTGLAGLSFTGSPALIAEAGIEVAGATAQGVGGGGPVTVQMMQIPRLRLGGVERTDQVGVIGAFPESLDGYWGLPIRGLISHAFLRPYKVQFDFDCGWMSLM